MKLSEPAKERNSRFAIIVLLAAVGVFSANSSHFSFGKKTSTLVECAAIAAPIQDMDLPPFASRHASG
jgi:hypothetical protein